MTKTNQSAKGTIHANPNVREEALSALQLWQTIEYLSPQKPPKTEQFKDNCVWEVNPQALDDREMPWKDSAKRSQFENFIKVQGGGKRKHTLYAGNVTGSELVDTVRALLNAPEIDFSEQRMPEGGSSLVVPLDEHGCVAGEIFVSTLPWAIHCMEKNQSAQSYDFSGFFGEKGIQQKLLDAVESLLRERNLIKEQDRESTSAKAEQTDADLEDGVAPTDPFAPEEDKDLDDQKVHSLTPDDVRAIESLVFSISGWTPKHPSPWRVKTQRASKSKSTDDPLNSFYAEDLERIQREYLKGNAGTALAQFLETPKHSDRCDLESTRDHLINGVHPSLTPKACWPGEFPLVTAQQFAVNAMMRDLKTAGLFSVNGPPGTGKTTMLKDILAAVVVQRADALATFDNPLSAFPSKIQIADHGYPVWGLHKNLRGFGVVVACAGNGAAENISKDLPGLSAIDQSLDVNYLAVVANSLGIPKEEKRRKENSWGMISAALGNQDNRNTFATDFWEGRNEWSEDARKRLPQDRTDPLRLFTLQDWVTELGHLAPSWSDAKLQYEKAKERAETALANAGALATKINANRILVVSIGKLHSEELHLTADLELRKEKEHAARASYEEAKERVLRCKAIVDGLRIHKESLSRVHVAQQAMTLVQQRMPAKSLAVLNAVVTKLTADRVRIQEDLKDHAGSKPNAWSAFFYSERKNNWNSRNATLEVLLDTNRTELDVVGTEVLSRTRWEADNTQAQSDLQSAQLRFVNSQAAFKALQIESGLTLATAEFNWTQASGIQDRSQAEYSMQKSLEKNCVNQLKTVRKSLKEKRELFDSNSQDLIAAGIDQESGNEWNLHELSRENFHRVSPYNTGKELFHARRDLFVAALDLHKAFIVHSWKRLKSVLFPCINMLQGKIAPWRIADGPMALWDALFLVVPLVSTTFASFPRLFRGIGREELAWVLIDEAGQASPQYCVGALWRAKRAVVVGDPRQLEPVVGIPSELLAPLQGRFKTDIRFVPPKASTQTMADISNRYGMYFDANDPEKCTWVGSPLIVHRRCIEPMFRIANKVAYEGKMVYGSGEDKLGKSVQSSRWVHINSQGSENHWIPAQAKKAIALIDFLLGASIRNHEGKLRVYVISPFKRVADNMEIELKKLYGRKDAEEMCGTVHTFQGREADFVIFLLGGDPTKPGVISTYAGKSPHLLNVAVTRAKKRLYVVGDLEFWTGSGDTNGYYKWMHGELRNHLLQHP